VSLNKHFARFLVTVPVMYKAVVCTICSLC